MSYRGRIAPTPSGYLHAGHIATFGIAHRRARERGGQVVLRIEDLDPQRCRAEFVEAALVDFRYFGFDWDEGPDVGGPHAPYFQSQRTEWYREVFERLQAGGHLFPCVCTRRDLRMLANAPHAGEEEPVYPGTCRARKISGAADEVAWRFRVPDGREVSFVDRALGECRFVAGRDFGDFPVWRRDGVPAYQLAVVADDHAMGITEVVRGEDLLLSTARQILLYEALGWEPPEFYHCPLLCDESGARLSKRDGAARASKQQGLRSVASS